MHLQPSFDLAWTWRLQEFFEFLCKIAGRLHVLLFAVPSSPFADMSDAELVAHAQQDMEAFTELFDRYFTRVYQFHFFRIRQQQDAEDLTSDTLTKVFKNLHTYDPDKAPLSAWIFSIARNTLIDFTRKNKAQIDDIEAVEPQEALTENFDMTTVEHSVLSEKLWDAIVILPERQQQIWALKLKSDLPHKEIAKILGTTENNVNVAISRSIKTLKKYLSYLNDA